MPIGPVGHDNVGVRQMFVSDPIDLDVRRKNIHDNPVVERNNPSAHLWSSDKFVLFRVHGKKVAFHADERPFVAFDGANEMTPNVVGKELAMNDVNIFAGVKNHTFVELYTAFSCAHVLDFKESVVLTSRNRHYNQ